MRKPLVAGNWKMNRNVEQASLLVQELLPRLTQVPEVERVLCPPYTSLMILSAQLAGTGVGIGAQNMHWADAGAYTGEISPQMVREFCESVIIGHSERRAYFNETDETVNKKLKAALALGLVPIVCIGETLEQYESGKTREVVTRQVLEGFKEIDPAVASTIVVAYEPVWAIGTGETASPEQAEKAHVYIRGWVAKVFGDASASQMRIQYGGSVTPKTVEGLFEKENIDGFLVGGASLKPVDFAVIVQACA